MALQSPAPLLEELSASLRQLETTLDPLLSRKLALLTQKLESGSSIASTQTAKAAAAAAAVPGEEDTEAKPEDNGKIELSGKLDSARLNASVAYVLLDLVWMYLKVKGMDPTTHPVMAELNRVKEYFHKIKAAQDTDSSDARSNLDQSAAARFIRHAIGTQVSAEASAAKRGAIQETKPDPKRHKRFR